MEYANQLAQEMAAYERMREELEAHSLYKYVLFKGDDLVGTYESFETAGQEAIAKFGKGPYLIRQVGMDRQPMPMPASVAYAPVYAAR
jgi:hypothetical protein